ncbi:hypothetical protein GXW83_00885 [Streptacidiphilus sp. PB12-B1b]|uniref:hypothetical protein n=1 Tax=Streptacidiphilus sp. PB12-B1b TaxID=2705012 RepID=UPI0015FB88D6|nr:hypothetical protein [Streptacidiphilus sp. PB12-B1b]QMU74551.1 hypothetical protein GXW83_00885 [Streptacidiphilus sp. PB12-B1b]
MTAGLPPKPLHPPTVGMGPTPEQEAPTTALPAAGLPAAVPDRLRHLRGFRGGLVLGVIGAAAVTAVAVALASGGGNSRHPRASHHAAAPAVPSASPLATPPACPARPPAAPPHPPPRPGRRR